MSYIYSITNGNYYKIGWAKDVEKRLKQLQTGNPLPLKIHKKIECSCVAQAMMRERQIHKSARKHRILGEWFTEDVFNNKYWRRYDN